MNGSRFGYLAWFDFWQSVMVVAVILLCVSPSLRSQENEEWLTKKSIRETALKVNQYQLDGSWKNIDRNWKRATWYTGMMAFYQVSNEQDLLEQAHSWGSKHGWRIGSEWIYPANRMACSQTYLELYFISGNEDMIKRTRQYMDDEVTDNSSAFEQGWYYVDALYVGTPAYIMMSSATGNPKYAEYGHKIFREVTDSLFDKVLNLYFRDLKAKQEKSKNGKPVIWSRGNGWAIASIPRIINFLEEGNPNIPYYAGLLQKMAEALSQVQSSDGLWRSNLADTSEYPMPETSGSAFFTYALAWGVNNGYLDREKYTMIIIKAWQGLINSIDENGRINWCQPVARKPGRVEKNDYDEYVAGAFLLAASEIYLMVSK
jgi:rhamnogalacturonyl hydrolase YesR